MNSRPVDPALIADPDFAAGFAFERPTPKVPPLSEILRMNGLRYTTSLYLVMRQTMPSRSEAFLQGVACAHWLESVEFANPVPLIPGPPVSEGLMLLYVAPDERRRGFIIAGVVRYCDVEQPDSGSGLYAMADDGTECPLSKINVLGHLPISIKGL